MTSRARARTAAFSLAAVVGVFHGLLKEPPRPDEVKEMSASILLARQWQGRYPADFSAPLLGGGEFRLADNVGHRIVLLNFFATWCQPCRAEMPELLRFVHSHRGEPLTVLFIDAAEPAADVRRFAAELAIDAPVALDAEKAIEKQYGVNSYPTTVLIGAGGRIQLYETGGIANADVSLEPLYRAARDRLARGPGISRDRYLAALAAQPPIGHEPDATAPRLGERQRQLAAAMLCPCGCSDKVLRCGCQTAKKIEKKLAGLPLAGKSDEEVVTALNREFCVGASLARSH
jgi:thiol-disulfide isomerase/thioredoxin